MSHSILIVTSIHPDFDSRIWKHATSLAKQGCEVHLVCPWEVRDNSVREGVNFHVFKKIRKRWQRFILVPWRTMRKLIPLIKKADIIHFHDIDLLPWMAVLALFRPVVYDVHENYAQEMLTKNWIPNIFRKPMYYVVFHGQRFLSSRIRNVVLVVPSQEIEFNHRRINSIHIRNYASLALLESVKGDYISRSDSVVYIGSQHINNGSILMIDIAERLIKACPKIRIYVSDRFSDILFRAKYIHEIERRGLQGYIQLVPNVVPHRIMDVLNNATVAINPNLRVPQQINGIHTKLFEFMAAGLPIVTSDLPHQVEVIRKSNAGLLAQPEDPDSFVKAIQSILSNKNIAIEMGRNGQRAFREYYCYEKQINNLIEFYQEIIQPK